MPTLLIFALTLTVAVLASGLVQRSMLSTAVLFLAVGGAVGSGGLDVIGLAHDHVAVVHLVEVTLFAVLFTDGTKLGVRDLRSAWRLPGRALVLGMPLTMGLIAVLAHWIASLPWTGALLLGAVLSPTDPVFASAIIGRPGVPLRLRRLLNVESGLNDGLALPFVVILLGIAGDEGQSLLSLGAELVGGVAIGVLIPYMIVRLERSHWFRAQGLYQPLGVFAAGMLVYTVAATVHVNLFLAAFSAGITVASAGPELREAFGRFGELIAELLELAALLVFGAVLTPSLLDIGLTGWLLAVLILVVVRPLALLISFVRTDLSHREFVAASWFGPKGFASATYALLVLQSGVADNEYLFAVAAATIALSMVAHSSTDVVVARWFRESDDEPHPEPAPPPEDEPTEPPDEPGSKETTEPAEHRSG